jgi:hypothetical protein
MNNVTFSAGGRFSGHADFWNTWRVDGENGFNSLHTRCLNEDTYCGLGNQPRWARRRLDDVEFWEEESAVFDLSGMTPRAYTYHP